jgi:predicted dehydrogenase
VFGAGSIGRRHIYNLITHLGVAPADIVAVDTSTDKLDALQEGVERMWLPDAGIEAPIEGDAVLICTPAVTHAGLVGRCASAKVPFFVEKPPAMFEQEMLDFLWETGVPHVVGFNWRWHRGYRRAAHLAQGAARVEFWCKTDMAKWPGAYDDVVSECCHEIDLALQWCGPVARLGRVAVQERGFFVGLHHDSGQESTVAVVADYDGEPERLVVLDGSYSHGGERFTGDLGPLLDQSYVDEMDHFLRVCEGAPSISTLEQARWTVGVMTAMRNHASKLVAK